MKIKEGEQLPNSEFYYLDSSGAAKKITTAEVFKYHKTIVIGVPGAFTKVCSAKHLPGYVNNYEEAKNKARSAESIKAVKAASGASNNKKPTVVGGGGQPKESLVDQLQSYNSIWK